MTTTTTETTLRARLETLRDAAEAAVDAIVNEPGTDEIRADLRAALAVTATSEAAAESLSWIRNLPEVGSPLTSLIHTETQMRADIEAAERLVAARRADLEAHVKRATEKAARYYSEAEIARARGER